MAGLLGNFEHKMAGLSKNYEHKMEGLLRNFEHEMAGLSRHIEYAMAGCWYIFHVCTYVCAYACEHCGHSRIIHVYVNILNIPLYECVGHTDGMIVMRITLCCYAQTYWKTYQKHIKNV